VIEVEGGDVLIVHELGGFVVAVLSQTDEVGDDLGDPLYDRGLSGSGSAGDADDPYTHEVTISGQIRGVELIPVGSNCRKVAAILLHPDTGTLDPLRVGGCNRLSAGPAAGSLHCGRGRVNLKVLPRPGSLSTLILPSCFSTNSLHNSRPRPLPASSSVPLVL